MSLGKLLWESFCRASGPVLAVLGFLGTLGTWLFRPDAAIPMIWVVLAATAFVTVLATLLRATTTALGYAGKVLPRVRLVAHPSVIYSDVQAVLLLEPSDLFVGDSWVSVYLMQEQQYEVLIAIGRVLAVQQNGLIQVGIERAISPDAAIIEKLLGNDTRILANLIVKPNVPRYDMRLGGAQ